MRYCLRKRKASRHQSVALTQSQPCIDALCYPHILDLIVDFAPPDTLRKLRQVSHTMADKVDPLLTEHLVVRFRAKLTRRLRLEHPDGKPFPVLSYFLERNKKLHPWGFYTIPRARIVDMHDPPLDSLSVALWNYIVESEIHTLRLYRTVYPHAVYRFQLPIHVPRLILDMHHSIFYTSSPVFTPMALPKVDTLVFYLHCDMAHPLLPQARFADMDLNVVAQELVIIFAPFGEAADYVQGRGILHSLMPKLARLVRDNTLTFVNADSLDARVRGCDELLAELARAAVPAHLSVGKERAAATDEHVKVLTLYEYRDKVGDKQFDLDTCRC